LNEKKTPLFLFVTKANTFVPPFFSVTNMIFYQKAISAENFTKLITYQLHLQPLKQRELLKLLKRNFFGCCEFWR